MLELLLMQYREIFGEDFPLLEFDGKQEIEVINILYDCVSKNLRYSPDRKIERRILEAPGINPLRGKIGREVHNEPRKLQRERYSEDGRISLC